MDFIDYDKALVVADRVAAANGLRRVGPLPKGERWERGARAADEITCASCGQLISHGRRPWTRKVCYEYDEWDDYCSRVCASMLQASPGHWTDFLERMGWTFWHIENIDAPVRWVKLREDDDGMPECIIAREGDANWTADVVFAERLMGQFLSRFPQLAEKWMTTALAH